MEKTGVPCPMAVAAAPPPPNRFVLTRKSIILRNVFISVIGSRNSARGPHIRAIFVTSSSSQRPTRRNFILGFVLSVLLMNSISSNPISQSNLLLTMANKISSSLYPNSDLLVSSLPIKLSCCTALLTIFLYLFGSICASSRAMICVEESFSNTLTSEEKGEGTSIDDVV